MGKFTQLIFSIIGATIGWFIGGPAGAKWGWFIGSTVGGLLALEDTHSSTSGPRITDFKAMSSRYGIPISKGYGTVRLAANVIWTSAVTEYEEKETTCIKIDVFFGLASTKQCSTKITYKYKQSAAFAFAEGPASSLTKVWADGKLIYDTEGSVPGYTQPPALPGPTDVEGFWARLVANGIFGTPSSGASTNNFNIYLGTTDQPIDPVMAQDLGADAIAYRSIVYLVAKDFDLDAFGYRLPTLTAEISFVGSADLTGNITLDFPLVGDPSLPDFDTLGTVFGKAGLSVGVNDEGDGSLTIHNVTDGTVFSGLDGAYPDGIPTGYVQVSPNYLGVRKRIINSENYFGPFDVRDGRQRYLKKYNTSDFVNLTYSTFDPITSIIWTTFSGGAAAAFKTQVSSRTDADSYRDYYLDEHNTQRYINGHSDWDVVSILPTSGGFTNGGGTQDEGREIFIVAGRAWWLVDGPGGVWINSVASSVTSNGSITSAPWYWRVKFQDDTNVSSVANWTYEPLDDSFIFYVDVAGTSPVGLYKVHRSFLLFALASHEINLPLSTDAGEYLNVTPVDGTAFQRGPRNGILRAAKNSTDLYVIDTVNMNLNQTITNVPGGLGTIGTLWFEDSGILRGGSFNIYYTRPQVGVGVSLDTVVTDLMTTIDGDPRERLVSSDLDVSELASDTLRGYPLIQQQTVRRAITPLQQHFFFDVVESDGKLKFIKRPKTQSFSMVENDLAAHEYGKTSDTVLVPVEYERLPEIQLPRELVVNYTDIDLDYNQGTQRYRKIHTESQSNTVITLPIVLTDDEAAQTAEKLLNSTWSERVAPFRFKTSMKYCTVEPTDTGTITMNDGKVHTIRIISASLGANGMMEFEAVNELSSVYTSSATGTGSENAPQVIDTSSAIVRAFDIPAIFIPGVTEGQAGVVIGMGYYGDQFQGGSVVISTSSGGYSGGGTRDATEGMTFGTTLNSIGHVNGPEEANIFDYETTIVMGVEGGPAPTSKTESQALNADPSGLLIVGREIIAFTNVSCTEDVRVTGTDISFVNATSSIDSTTTDFIAAGFEIDQVLRVYGADNNDNSTYWKISAVAQYKLTVTNAPTDESAGNSVTIFVAERTCTFSGGMLRGLYGTEEFMYHPRGEEITLAQNLMFAPVGQSSTEGMVTAVGTTTGGSISTDSVAFTNAALKPWSPVDVEATNLSDDIKIDWVRRDKQYGGGITDVTGGVDNSEASEAWEIDILDGYTEGSETDIVRTISGVTSSTYTYTEAQQIADWGAVRNTPMLVDIYQISSAAGRGFRRRTVVERNSNYAPIGETFSNETPGVAYSLGTDRLTSGTSLIEGSGDISPNALRLTTTVDNEFSAISFDEAAGGSDVEVLTVFEMQADSLTGITAGVILRGRGLANTDFSGVAIGLGGDPTDIFAMQHYIGGTSASIYSDSTAFAWTVGTKYAMRARYYKNRIQGKIWEYGDPEPGDWQLNYFDSGLGPAYGWIGPLAFRTSNDPLYHYFAWAHRGLKAA